jgi:hypothetical protein
MMPRKRKPVLGRPPTFPTPIGLSLLPPELEKLDLFASNAGGLSRAMAARWIIELYLRRRGNKTRKL